MFGFLKRHGQERAPVKREPRMYVLVRNDLPHGYQTAQSVHAASYLAAKNPLKLYQHPVVTVLNVNDEIELKMILGSLGHDGVDVFPFLEPDLDYELTAVACYDTGERFAGLPLMGKGLTSTPKPDRVGNVSSEKISILKRLVRKG